MQNLGGVQSRSRSLWEEKDLSPLEGTTPNFFLKDLLQIKYVQRVRGQVAELFPNQSE